MTTPRRIRFAVRLGRHYQHRWHCLIRFWSLPKRLPQPPTLWLGVRSN